MIRALVCSFALVSLQGCASLPATWAAKTLETQGDFDPATDPTTGNFSKYKSDRLACLQQTTSEFESKMEIVNNHIVRFRACLIAKGHKLLS
ncbi:MAG: hypothetical protein EBR17_02570 [Betaproteobacteria bacterium]|jgi:hypothetical protein|nr:hypothetical protein [Betaproteobacteria bacterium]NBX91439.1 hypothetical protein [Betaproteobacteria bacterium]